MKHTILFAITSMFAACGVCAAGNLVFNSSFELKNAGWNEHVYHKSNRADGSYRSAVSYPAGDAVSGSRALRIEPGPENVDTMVFSYNFPVKKNTDYTFSFYLKQVKPGPLSFALDLLSLQRALRYDASGRLLPDTGFANAAKEVLTKTGRAKVTLSGNWTRQICTFNSGNHSAYSIRIYMGGGSKGAVLIDDVQVEEGRSATAYAPKEALELAIQTESGLYEEPGQINGKVYAVSYTSDLNRKTELTLIDDFYDREIAKQTVDLNLKKGKVAVVPFTFKGKLPYGSYQIFSSLHPRITTGAFVRDWNQQPETIRFSRIKRGDESYLSAAKFVAVPKPRKKTDEGFRIGTTGSYTPAGDKYIMSEYGPTENRIQLIRLAGGNVHRTWDGALALWKTIEPEQGKFDWTRTDYEIEQAAKTGTDVMCVIGGLLGDHRGIDIFLPKWVRDRDRSGNPNGTPMPADTYFGQLYKKNYFRPQLSDWRAYVSAIAKRYKGKIKFYEILNESNLYMYADNYMEYMKAASEEIRKADPDAKILGICSTSDFGANIDDFIGKCLKLGADKYMDHITIHPYAKLDNSIPTTQMDARRKLLGNLKKFGYKSGLWNGENYYIIPDWMPATDYAARVLPEDLARHLIIDMGEGCTGSTATHFQTLTSPRGMGLMVGNHGRALMNPDARFAAHAATAHFIAGAKPLATHDLRLGALAYTFRRGDTLHTAIWNSRAPVPTELNIPPMRHKIYDMMANPVQTEKPLPLDAKPRYIEWAPEVSVADAIAWVNSHAIRSDVSFLTDRVLIGREDGGNRLIFAMQNLTGKPLDRKTFSASSDAFRSPVAQNCRNWKDFGFFTFSIPVELQKNDAVQVRFSAEDFPKFTLTRPAYPVQLLTLGPVPHTSDISRNFHGKPTSPEDFSAAVTLRADFKGGLHVTVNVKDDKPGKPSNSGWDTDSIELFIDRDPFSGDPVKYGPKTEQLIFPRNVKQQNKGNVSCRITEKNDGWTADIRIPVRYEDFLGLDIAVNDSDGEHRKAQLVWNGTDRNFVERSGFKLIRVTPAFTSRVDIRVNGADGKPLRTNRNDVTGRSWTPQEFTVTPAHDGKLPLLFMSGYSINEQYTAEYRNISVSGGTLKNADFSEKRPDGRPKYWFFDKHSGLRAEDGKTVLYSIHNFPCKGEIEVKAGIPVTVKYESRVKIK